MVGLDENQLLERLETTTSPINDDLGLFGSIKRHLRELGNEQDLTADDALRSAIDDVEQRCRRTFRKSVSSTAFFRGWSRLYWLPHPPHQSVASVKYYDGDNVLQTVAASNYRTPNSTRNGIRIEVDWQFTFPTLYDRLDPVQIAYTRGYASNDDIPRAVFAAIRLIAESNFDGDPKKAAEGYARLQPYVYRGRP